MSDAILEKLNEVLEAVSLIRHEIDRGPVREKLEEIVKLVSEAPQKRSSDELAVMASKYLKIKGTEWYALSNTAQLKVVHQLSASVLSQYEPKTAKPNEEDNSD